MSAYVRAGGTGARRRRRPLSTRAPTAILQRIGLDVAEAEDGESALRSAARQPPSLVLLDVQLPFVGGYEVCRELRERYGDDLPIVFVSGTRVESGDGRRASCSVPTTTSRSRSILTNSWRGFVACSDDVRRRWRGQAENLRYPS